jgi:hypothetical protein
MSNRSPSGSAITSMPLDGFNLTPSNTTVYDPPIHVTSIDGGFIECRSASGNDVSFTAPAAFTVPFLVDMVYETTASAAIIGSR